MNASNIKAELLAPAGNFEALKAAVTNGADAVYLGLGTFNARASAQNFTIDTLRDAVKYAHLFGVKIYLAINTLLKNSESPQAANIAKQAWDSGISAVIVQDLGFATELKKEYPEIVLHASTQMGVHNLYGALAAQALGMERVILSRETPLSEIVNIAENCSVELEYFVHGALCCGFSGNCYFSSLVSGKSGNRGRCLQLCRKRYLLKDKIKSEYGYWLSTRDTMLVNDLQKLADAGISSFKIEGRMRRPEYVAEATRIYRKALDNVISGDDITSLKLMYNRGNFSKAHLHGADSDIIYPALQSHLGIKLGYVKSVQKGKAFLSCAVSKGDGIKLLREGNETGHALVLLDGYETGFVGDVKKGDDVFLTDSAKNNFEINSRKRKLPLAINVKFSLAQKLCAVRLESSEKIKEFVYSVPLETPEKNPVSHEDIGECLTSLGNTDFECKAFNIEYDKEFFVQKAKLKQLRRDFLSDFEQHLLSSFERPCAKNYKFSPHFFENLKPVEVSESCTIIMCRQSDAKIYQNYADYIAIKPDNYAKLLDDLKSLEFIPDKNKYMLDLPAVSFDSDLKLLQEIIETKAFNKFIVNNLYGLSFATAGKIIFGYKMNMLNKLIKFTKIKSIENSYTDLNAGEDFIYMFGRAEIMQFVHCYYKLRRGCGECSNEGLLSIVDDRGESYEIRKQKIKNCYNLLISSLPINLSGKNLKKKFIDATSLIQEEKENLLDFLKGKTKKIVIDKSLSDIRKLD